MNVETAALPPHGWLVVACKGGWERKARHDLVSQGYRVWLPIKCERRMNRGTPTIRREPFFPGYVFVAKVPGIGVAEMRIGAIRNTRGVVDVFGYICADGYWMPSLVGHPYVLDIRRELWADWHALRREIDAARKPRQFDKGEEVEVLNGPFAGRRAQVERLFVVSPQERITLLLDFCGGQRHVRVQAAHVAKTATIMGGGSVSSAQYPRTASNGRAQGKL